MSNDAPPKWSRQRPASMVFRWFMVFAIFVLLALLFDLIAFLEPPFSALVFLAIGWILSGWRMVQGINDYQNLWWWLLGCIVLVVFANTFVRSVMSGKPRQWNVKKSVAATGICWFALFAGMCLAGSVHQVGWLLGSDEPWVDSGNMGRGRATFTEMTYRTERMARILKQHHTPKVWTSLSNPSGGYLMNYVIRTHAGTDGVIRTLSIWPRSSNSFRKLGGYVVDANGTITPYPYERMQAILSKPD